MDLERPTEKDRSELSHGYGIIQNALEHAGFKLTLVSPGATNPKTTDINEPVIWGIESPKGSPLSLTLNVTS